MIKNILLTALLVVPSFCQAKEPVKNKPEVNEAVQRMEKAVTQADLQALIRANKLLDLKKYATEREPLYARLIELAQEKTIEKEDNIGILRSAADFFKVFFGVPLTLVGLIIAAKSRSEESDGYKRSRSETSFDLSRLGIGVIIGGLGSLLTYKGIRCSSQRNYLTKLEEIVTFLTKQAELQKK